MGISSSIIRSKFKGVSEPEWKLCKLHGQVNNIVQLIVQQNCTVAIPRGKGAISINEPTPVGRILLFCLPCLLDNSHTDFGHTLLLKCCQICLESSILHRR